MFTQRNNTKKNTKTITRIACGLALITLLGNSGFAAVITIQKDLRHVWNPQNQAVPGVGSATWGQNSAKDKNVAGNHAPAPVNMAFNINAAAASLPPTKKSTATHNGAKSEVEITVGKATALDPKTIAIDSTIKAVLTVPGGKGGIVTAAGKVNLNGKASLTELQVNGVKFGAGKPAFRKLAELKRRGVVLDPINLTLSNSDETISADIFKYDMEYSYGAAVGLNSSDMLELEILEGASARAEFLSETLVDWATDYDGSVILDDGVFTATGIYGDPSLWSLDFSPSDPAYVTRATLIDPGMVDFNLDVDPTLSSSQDYDIAISSDLYAEIETVPEPLTVTLLTLGTLSLLRRRRILR